MDDFCSYEDAKDILLTIGVMTVSWAQVQGTLDAAVATIYFEGGGNTLEPDHPRTSLSRKLSFLRRCHKEIPELRSLKREGNQLIEAFHALKQKRHDIVHGFFTGFTQESVHFAVLKKDRGRPNGFSFDPQTVTHKELLRTLGSISDLDQLAGEYLKAVALAIKGEVRDNPQGSIPD